MIADAAGSPSNGKGQNETRPIFREYGPTEWAKPVKPTKFLIKQALCTDTWGVNRRAGEIPENSRQRRDWDVDCHGKKSIPIELFPVYQGKVCYIIGEGGEKQILRLLHRMCRAYGIKLRT